MKNKKNTARRNFFAPILVAILLAVSSALLSAAVVYPLWKWATLSPASYTWCFIVLLLVLILFVIAGQCKKKGTLKVTAVLLRIIIAIAGIFTAVYLVITDKKLFALGVLVLGAVIFGVLGLVLKKEKKHS